MFLFWFPFWVQWSEVLKTLVVSERLFEFYCVWVSRIPVAITKKKGLRNVEDALVFSPWSLPCKTAEHGSATLPLFSLGQTVGLMPDRGLLFVASGVMTQMAGPLKPPTGFLSRGIVKAALFDLAPHTVWNWTPFVKSSVAPGFSFFFFASRQMKEWKQT